MRSNAFDPALQHDREEPIRDAPARTSIWMGARLDFERAVPLRKSYIVASSYRCGSTFFCSQLWRTGVLGAPYEYLNIGASRMLRDVMMHRLQAETPEDYFVNLLRCRTSRNGVFGMKVLFPHFPAAIAWYPSMLKLLSPLTYIYLGRRDKLAQAVSLAKALQSDAWESLDHNVSETLVYKEVMIAQCLREVAYQDHSWRRWFRMNGIAPFVVHYEDVLANAEAVTRSIIDLLGVAADEADEVSLPAVEKQSDDVNLEWRTRFEQAAPDWESWFPLAEF